LCRGLGVCVHQLKSPQQNITFTDEATTKWYKQTVVSKDIYSDGLLDLLNEYDGVPNVRTTHAEVNNVFTKDENTQGQLEEQIVVRAFEIG
jgi:hypothetical protein